MLAAMADPNETRRAVWTRHWASGAAHSCAGSFGDTYGGGIAAAWRTWHADTAAGARVLDIATGNGALPRLLAQLRPELACQVDAVDLADTAPDWLRSRPADAPMALRFHAGVAAESLPFPDAAFDAAISQYGLEYADLDAAVPELLRVLAPRGRIALVLHHAGSRPVTLAAVEIAHLDWLRGDDGLLPAARAMLAPLARAATPAGRAALAGDAAAEAARVRFNAAQAMLARRAEAADGADVLGEAQDAVAGVLSVAIERGEAAAGEAWARLDRALADARWRLQELRDCALDASAVQRLVVRLQSPGRPATLQTLEEQGHLMAWWLRVD
jgi:SAM-dependent methyltransferase